MQGLDSGFSLVSCFVVRERGCNAATPHGRDSVVRNSGELGPCVTKCAADGSSDKPSTITARV